LTLLGYCSFVVIPPANELRATPENPLKWVKTIDSSAEYGCQNKAGEHWTAVERMQCLTLEKEKGDLNELEKQGWWI